MFHSETNFNFNGNRLGLTGDLEPFSSDPTVRTLGCVVHTVWTGFHAA